ncbi:MULTISPECIES: hypothetical protein [unclassified Streptomyces]|uniref:hypothetical protein n=1 Tax=unclassified Streptomyces TaxID=2593676 RepID=UPI002E25C953
MSDGSLRDASVVVARDENDLVALLSTDFPAHGGAYLARLSTAMEAAIRAFRSCAFP